MLNFYIQALASGGIGCCVTHLYVRIISEQGTVNNKTITLCPVAFSFFSTRVRRNGS